MRKSGYYWVRYKHNISDWEIALYDADCKVWEHIGGDETSDDNHFDEIDETPITRGEK